MHEINMLSRNKYVTILCTVNAVLSFIALHSNVYFFMSHFQILEKGFSLCKG